MFETFRNAWKIEDLRKKLLFTLFVIVLFRFGCAVPVPFIAPTALQAMVGQSGSVLVEYLPRAGFFSTMRVRSI